MDDRPERVRAMLLGVAIGDALGWPFEVPRRVTDGPHPDGAFHRWRRRAGSRFWGYEEALPAGTYSDDTQLTLAIGRALLHEDWFEHLVRRELPAWRLYERGGGRTVLSSAAAWARGIAPWRQRSAGRDHYFRSGANGAAMRIAPHAAIGDRPLERVVADAIATHGHPRALLGATMHMWALRAAFEGGLGSSAAEALAAARDHAELWGSPSLLEGLPDSWHAAAGEDYKQQWNTHRGHTLALLDRACRWADQGAAVAESEVLDNLGATDPATNGAGDVCAVAALYLAGRYASQPVQALQAAARQAGADTDTLASMVGGLLGAWLGHDAVESFHGVQDANTITALAAELVVAPDPRTGIVEELDPKPAIALDDFTTQLAQGPPEVHLPDGRTAKVLQQRILSDREAKNEVTGHYLRCDDGQGLLVVSRRKRPTDDAREKSKESARPTSDQSARSDEQPIAATANGEAPPSVDLIVCCPDPPAVLQLLKCAGLTGTVEETGWRIDGLPIVIAPVQDRARQLQLEPSPFAIEIRIAVPNLAQAREQLTQGGWKSKVEPGGLVVIEGGVGLRLTEVTRRAEPTSQ